MSEVVREIEMSMEMTKEKIRQAEVLERLEKLPDFEEFILKGFCEKHALGLVSKRVSPNYQDPVNSKYIEDQLKAVGSLKLYFRYIKQEGALARESLKTAETERDLALEEANA